jgi:hypothetical protein
MESNKHDDSNRIIHDTVYDSDGSGYLRKPDSAD